MNCFSLRRWSVVCACLCLTTGGVRTFATVVDGNKAFLESVADFAESSSFVTSPWVSTSDCNAGNSLVHVGLSVSESLKDLGTLSSEKKLSAGVRIKRLNGKKPLIDMESFKQAGYAETDGKNINGPCVVKLPDWLPVEKRVDKRAKYYLYFAHHHGKYIRLAWSEKVTGPYQLVDDSPLYGERANAALSLKKIPPVIGEVTTGNHVASPVVVIDDERREFKLYYHAPAQYKNKGKRINQVTFFATSPDGLQFHKNIAPVYLGIFYFSPFNVNGRWYAFTNRGELCEAPEEGEIAVPANFNAKNPLWKNWGRFFEKTIADYCSRNGIKEVIGVRHLSQVQKGNVLHVFFSSREDTPERLYHVCVDVSDSDCRNWKVGPMELVMAAEEDWEGGKLTPKKSVDGYSPKPVNEIRDTFVYTEKGRHYLFYCAGGERGIGVASLKLK